MWSFKEYLLRTYYVLGTDAGDRVMHQTDHILVVDMPIELTFL